MGEINIKKIHNVHKEYRKMNFVNPYLSASTPFVSTWNTENLSTGSSLTKQVKLPLVFTGTYNFSVEWGDGTTSTITAYNQAAVTHTYTTTGTYEIKIKGTCIGWQFNNIGDKLKMLSVTTWGKLKIGASQGGYFYGCANLNLSSVQDILDLTGVTNLSGCFASCIALTTINRINEWNTTSVTNMTSMFGKSYNFNSNIGNWNVSNVSQFAQMFECLFITKGKFNNGGSPDINNWTLKQSANLYAMFGNTNFNQPLNNWAVRGPNTSLSNMFSSCNSFNQDIGSWDVSSVIDFQNMFLNATAFNNGGSSSIGNWVIKTNASVVTNAMFSGASSFNQNLNLWDISRVVNLNSMFTNAGSFNNGLASGVPGIMTWNGGSATTTAGMFSGASSFNQNVGALNPLNCADFTSMFNGATKFNNGGSSDINNWTLKTTGTVNMTSMFRSTQFFNQPLNLWNTIAVTNMTSMFQSAFSFNNGASFGASGVFYLNTSNVTTFGSAFLDANAFNQNIGGWNVSKATIFTSMFSSCDSFNNGGSSDINNWVFNSVSNITMNAMFNQCPFNQPLNLWITTKVTNMNRMFAQCAFNQNISLWDTSNVIDMGFLFDRSEFNNGVEPVADLVWNTQKVTNMEGMFNSNIYFNRNIGSWNVSSVINFTNFMSGKTSASFSASNLDAIYNGWSSRPVLASKVITFGTAKYTAAGSAGRAILTGAPNLWTITDGGI